MNKTTLYVTIIAIILMFVSLVSWIVNQMTFAILSANLGVLLKFATSITITWDPIDNVGGYEVYRATSENGPLDRKSTV